MQDRQRPGQYSNQVPLRHVWSVTVRAPCDEGRCARWDKLFEGVNGLLRCMFAAGQTAYTCNRAPESGHSRGHHSDTVRWACSPSPAVYTPSPARRAIKIELPELKKKKTAVCSNDN
jgi:hypothetical protein